MNMCQENLNYNIQEISRINNYISYNELLETLEQVENEKTYIEENDIDSLEIKYNAQYTYNELQKICEYYDLETRLCKQDLIQQIVIFEKNNENIEKVYKRKKLWNYIQEIKNDNCLKKYLMFE